MELSNQSQKAGDNSTQMQATTIVNNYITNNGIDETRARLICKEEFEVARKELTHEAQELAIDRVNKLEDRLMPKMQQYDESYKIFADPSFQIALKKAQLVAAASERENDYDMLAELLLHRAQEGHDRWKRLGITKAIEIVDQISDEAVVAITVVYAFDKYFSTSTKLGDALMSLNSFYGKLLAESELPVGDKWLEHLDLLSVIRLGIRNINEFKKIRDLILLIFTNHLITGIQKDSEEYKTIIGEFVKNQLPINCFVQHSLKSDYIIMDLPENLDDCRITKVIGLGQQVQIKLDESKKELLSRTRSMINKPDSENIELRNSLVDKWNSYPTLKKIGIWWDAIPCHFTITPVGQAIANSYIHGKDSSLPLIY